MTTLHFGTLYPSQPGYKEVQIFPKFDGAQSTGFLPFPKIVGKTSPAKESTVNSGETPPEDWSTEGSGSNLLRILLYSSVKKSPHDLFSLLDIAKSAAEEGLPQTTQGDLFGMLKTIQNTFALSRDKLLEVCLLSKEEAKEALVGACELTSEKLNRVFNLKMIAKAWGSNGFPSPNEEQLMSNSFSPLEESLWNLLKERNLSRSAIEFTGTSIFVMHADKKPIANPFA